MNVEIALSFWFPGSLSRTLRDGAVSTDVPVDCRGLMSVCRKQLCLSGSQGSLTMMAVDGVLLPNCVVLCCVSHAYDNDLCVPRDIGLKDLGSDEEAIGRLKH